MMPLTGSFYVIVADLRSESPTFKQWVGIELSAEKKNILLVPIGCANGFQTLEDNSEMLYFMSDFYSPEHASGISYQDPQFQFVWPLGAPSAISEKDIALPNFTE
jgi:dTDP-4-dehydrorhamnose 3,5-epimerase